MAVPIKRLPETIGCVIAELDSAIHGETKPIQQQCRISININIIDFKSDYLFFTFLLMDCRIKFGNDGFTFQEAKLQAGHLLSAGSTRAILIFR